MENQTERERQLKTIKLKSMVITIAVFIFVLLMLWVFLTPHNVQNLPQQKYDWGSVKAIPSSSVQFFDGKPAVITYSLTLFSEEQILFCGDNWQDAKGEYTQTEKDGGIVVTLNPTRTGGTCTKNLGGTDGIDPRTLTISLTQDLEKQPSHITVVEGDRATEVVLHADTHSIFIERVSGDDNLVILAPPIDQLPNDSIIASCKSAIGKSDGSLNLSDKGEITVNSNGIGLSNVIKQYYDAPANFTYFTKYALLGSKDVVFSCQPEGYSPDSLESLYTTFLGNNSGLDLSKTGLVRFYRDGRKDVFPAGFSIDMSLYHDILK